MTSFRSTKLTMKTKSEESGAHHAGEYTVNGHVLKGYHLSKRANSSNVEITGKYMENVKVEKTVKFAVASRIGKMGRRKYKVSYGKVISMKEVQVEKIRVTTTTVLNSFLPKWNWGRPNGKAVEKPVVENLLLQLHDDGFYGESQPANAEYDDGGEEPNKLDMFGDRSVFFNQ